MAADELLSFTGVLLFLLGLLTGFVIPKAKAPRIGLSAHLAATQSGVALIAFAFLWPKIGLPAGWERLVAQTLWLSLYTIWFGLVLAALWGTGRVLPIAGAGHQAILWKERTAISLIGIGSIACLLAVIAVLVLWNWVPG
ncbi:MAG: hydroxylaminobenzene mutase [Proteobacteria bacterium]|nr:hydroxylaminobenzene mutase [Pseudomonadota bacterium]